MLRRALAVLAFMSGLLAAASSLAAGPGLPLMPVGKDGLLQPVAVFGKDERGVLPEGLAGLKGRIGLFFNNDVRTVCTAFCVAPDLVATAAHCVFRSANDGPPPLEGYWFTTDVGDERSYSRIAGTDDGTAAQSVMAGATKLSVKPPIDASSDWAAIRLADPVCRAGALPIEATEPKEIVAAAAEKRVFGVAYHRDYKEWELALSPDCDVRDEFEELRRPTVEKDFDRAEGLVLHKCDTGEGSSGSPLLMTTEQGPVVVGINVGTYVQSRVVMRDGEVAERSKPRTLANTGIAASAFAGSIERFRDDVVATETSDIAEFQIRLRRLNLFAGVPDGNFGELTRAAIKAYERSLGLPETGMPTAEIARRLQDAPPLPERKPVTETGSL